MSTKKRLLYVVKKIADIKNNDKKAFDQISAYEITQDLPKFEKELTMLYEELERKQNTPLSHKLLVKNGFKYEEMEEDDDCSPYHFYTLNFPLYIERIGGDFFITDTDIELKTVADLEDALDLCCIDKEIELL